jgi:hypothetical protein
MEYTYVLYVFDIANVFVHTWPYFIEFDFVFSLYVSIENTLVLYGVVPTMIIPEISSGLPSLYWMGA